MLLPYRASLRRILFNDIKLMKKSDLFKLFLIIALIMALSAIIYFRKTPLAEEKIVKEAPPIHYFGDSNISLAKINLKVFYFIPEDRQGLINNSWQNLIEPAVKSADIFHKIQFFDRSKINYEIYPTPVIGFKKAIDYDTEDTNRGNPRALENIFQELNERVLFSKIEKDEFLAIYIIYQGVGASGAKNASLLSFDYLADKNYEISKNSLFYHEFAHALGMPDHYDLESGIDNSFDILGFGKNKPLENAFIGISVKKEMGL